MSVPTVNVTINVNGSSGAPVEGATVTAKLQAHEVHNGFVVDQTAVATTDANGVVVLALWPNELGTQASEYEFVIYTPDGLSLKVRCAIPDRDCNLSEIVNLGPYTKQTTADVFTAHVLKARDDAAASKAAAAVSEANALASENNASQFAADARQSKSAALASSVSAGTSAGQAAAAQSAAERARDAAQTAQNVSETAQAAAESARDVTILTRDSAISEIQTQQNLSVSAVQSQETVSITALEGQESDSITAVKTQQASSASSIQASGQAELDKLTALVPAVFDSRSFFNATVSALLSGQILGTEGLRKIIATTSVTISARVIRNYFGIPVVRLQADASFSESLSLGALNSLDAAYRIVLFGNSGMPYVGYHIAWAATEGTAYMDFLPKFGDFRFDVTEGENYLCHVCRESDDVADLIVGTMNASEVFIGSALSNVTDLSSILPAGSYGMLNIGYRDGKTFQNQFISEAEYNESTGLLVLYLSRPATNLKYAVVEVRTASGEWILWSPYAGIWGDSVFTYTNPLNSISLDLLSSYLSHGYSSVEDMRQRSAVRVRFPAVCRRFRPINNPENVQIIGDYAYIYNGDDLLQGRAAVHELLNGVSAGSADLGKWTPITAQRKYLDSGRVWELSYEPVLPQNTASNPAVVMVFGQYVEGGTSRIAVWFKELIYDPDTGGYGDDGRFYIVDGVVCVLDQNGNYIQVGCMGFDTGTAVPA